MRILTLLFLLNIFITPIEARSIRIFRYLQTLEGQLFITGYGAECPSLRSEAQAIRSWSIKLGEEVGEIPPCLCRKEVCRIDLDTIAPQVLKRYFRRTSLSEGPNCWNTSLRSSGILPYATHTNGAEIKFWMNSPLCRELEIHEAAQPGDIIAIRKGQEQQEVHGFIYLTENTSFTKNAVYLHTDYILTHPTEVFREFRLRKQACERIKGMPSIDSPCFNRPYANYFRCSSYQSYFERRRSEPEDRLYQQLYGLDERLEQFIFDWKGESDSPSFKAIRKELKKIRAKAKKLRNKSTNEYGDYFWGTIYHRADSLEEMIRNLF